MHPWYEPLNKVSEFNQKVQIPLVTPIIGEKVLLDNEQQVFTQWWKNLK